MKVRKLKRKEHERTRKLWEEIFKEDDRAFLDYYYGNKTCGNQIYVIEEQNGISSMLHLNPYKVYMGENYVKSVNYIVAVATLVSRRGQGLMRRLLQESLNDMAEKGEPFTFLMPASEAIYAPFSFQTVYRQNKFQVDNLGEIAQKEVGSEIRIEELDSSDGKIEELVDFSKRILKEKFQVYTKRNKTYYENLLKEEKCQNGGILLFYKEEKKSKVLIGYTFYEIGEFISIREFMIKEELGEEILYKLNDYLKSEKKQVVFSGFEASVFWENMKSSPTIMARILNMKTMIETLTAKRKIVFTLGVKDDIVKANNGIFDFEINIDGGKIIKREEQKNKKLLLKAASIEEVPIIDIGELTAYLFGVSEEQFPILEEMKQINKFDKIFLNEIV
jgi:hypothetical protein